MQGNLSVMDCGAYDFIDAVGEFNSENYIALYASLFEKRRGSENVCFLIDVRNHPSVLDSTAFKQVLTAADKHTIQHIHMFVVSNDESRPTIGRMFEALADDFHVGLKIDFFPTLERADVALQKHL